MKKVTKKTVSSKKIEKKVTVGEDEFCPTCMEWREYDEEGKCKICRRVIKKKSGQTHKTTSEHDLADFTNESDDDAQTNEF